MEKIINRPFLSIAFLTALSWYLFFLLLGGLPLTDPDEAFYAETAREMLQRNDWITPHIFDKPQFEKPAFFYWLVMLSFKAFGINEFSARLPSAAFGLIGVIALYFLGKVLFGKRIGFLSAVILGTNIEYIVLARGCLTDMTLFALLVLGVTFFFYGEIRGRWYFYLLSSAAFALAVLTKGPIAVLIPAMAFALYMPWSGDWAILRRIPWFWCIVVFSMIAAPWHMAIYNLHKKEFIDAFFGFQNVTRFFESEHKIGSQVYYNIPVLFAGFFPWSIFLPAGLWHIFRHTTRAARDMRYEHRYSVFLLCWFIVIFLFFTASSTKLPTYIFPCWMSISLATAIAWNDFMTSSGPRWLRRAMRLSYYILLGTIPVILAVAFIFIKIDYPDAAGRVMPAAAMLTLGFLLSALAFLKNKISTAFFLIALAVAMFLYPTGKHAIPMIDRYESSKEISGKLSEYIRPGERVGSESHYRAGIAFYLGIMPINLDLHQTLVELLDSSERAWFVLKEKNHIQIYTLDTPPFCKKPSYAVYQLGKKVIFTNIMPRDGKYLIKRERRE